MLETKPTIQGVQARLLNHRSGLVFALPHPVIVSRNTPYSFSTSPTGQNSQNLHTNTNKINQIGDNSKNNTVNLNGNVNANNQSSLHLYTKFQHQVQAILKRKKKQKSYKSHSLATIQKQKSNFSTEQVIIQPKDSTYQKSALKQTLYRKFMQKTKRQVNGSSLENKESLNTHTNVKLRQLNLVILSKRQEMKSKSQKIPLLDQKLNKQLPIKQKASLPQFGRSKSSFYKYSDNNTLSFLSKTIFSQIQTHFTTHFPKKKAIEPIQLGISKAKIAQKNTRGSKKRQLNFHKAIDDNNQQYYNQIFQNYKLQNNYKLSPNTKMNNFNETNVYNANSSKNYFFNKINSQNKKIRKNTELKGWEQQAVQFNIFNQHEQLQGQAKYQ